MSQYRKPNPRSNWRRPKPKIYDCNKRDLENLYQPAYGEYLSTKADIEARRLDRDGRNDTESLSKRFEQRRAASLSYGDDEPRRFFPNREVSNGPPNHPESSFRSKIVSSEDTTPSFVRSSTSSSRQMTSLNGADDEMAGIESRLTRLRRLREELGLPAEAGGSDSNGTASRSSKFESTRSTRTVRSPSENRAGETSRYRSERSTRNESITRTSPSRNGYERKTYSSRTEGTSTSNGLDDTSKSYSSFRSKANSDVDDMASYEASVTSRSRARKGVDKPSLDGLDLEYDDETLLADMRKKLPSSSEILERIKNMDMD